MTAGRGVGHTGETLDKLESIPGFSTRRSLSDASAQLQRVGCVIIGQSDEVMLADGSLYAWREANGTAENIAPIAPSILGGRLAESLNGLVLDGKFGCGALVSDPEQGGSWRGAGLSSPTAILFGCIFETTRATSA
jgi:thymidine phosphorylase